MMVTSSDRWHLVPCFKQHTVVDDKGGVILDVAVTTGEAIEGNDLRAQLDRVGEQTGKRVQSVTADVGYGRAKSYAGL